MFILSGCMGFVDEDTTKINIELDVDSNYGLIMVSFEDGEETNRINPVIGFSFSNSSNINDIEILGIIPGDGRDPIIIEYSEGVEIEVEFTNHGLYEVTAFGIDKEGSYHNVTMEIMIEKTIDWYENNTASPEVLEFDTSPGNNFPIPSYFVLNSSIQNPSILEIDGRDVDIKWDIVNHEGVCQTANENIQNGDTKNWKTIHFGPFSTHEIYLTIEDGQDRINVYHNININYN
tara:strand:- start:8690 stop:9388 length:699 start_codon:yes stop_codon:yes gene_type:complete